MANETHNHLEEIAKKLVAPGKGILAADESTGTIKKRLASIGVESNPESNRVYRQLLFTTPGIKKYISGVIMFDETIRQSSDDGVSFPKLLADKGIYSGIKVDQGKDPAPNSPDEFITKGLDGLGKRLREYKELGAEFAKWRAAITIGEGLPTDEVLHKNAEGLADYAKDCQEEGIVPIVEPEVLTDGNHDLNTCEHVTYKTLKVVFEKLSAKDIYYPGMLLKPNWVHHGKEADQKATNLEIAQATLRVMREVVPDTVPGLVFLSGGDSPEESTSHLDLMNELDDDIWQISFSFGRALQQSVLKSWKGKEENVKKAQDEFLERAKLNSLARTGDYDESMED